MTRRLGIAMTVSAAIHLAAFVIADRFLLGDFSPSVISTPLFVSIDSPGVSPAAAAQDAVQPLADVTTAAAQQSPPPVTPSNRVPAAAPPVTREAPANPSDDAADRPATVVSEAAASSGDSDATTAVLVTSNADATWSVPVRATLSPRQEKMLTRKIAEWTEEMQDQPDLADVSWTQDGQEYRAHFSTLPADAETGIQRVLVEISTDEDGKRLSTEMQLKRLAFSSYAQFINRWNPRVRLHDDVLDGRFHTNSRFRIMSDSDAQPVFHQKVTTAAGTVDVERPPGSGPRVEIFQGGIEKGVRTIQLPREFSLSPDLLDAGDGDVHVLSEDSRITFRSDGSYTVQAIDSGAPGRTGVLSAGTTYFVGDGTTAISVRGTVNGRVLVYSPERIVIEDDIVYEQDPEVVPGADDILGLVSDKVVEVAPADVTGPGDLLIQAAIYAKRRFSVRKSAVGQPALLSLYGSLSAGTLSATEPRYATKIRFDRRLDEMRPPGFPVTDRFELESWDAGWNVETIN